MINKERNWVLTRLGNSPVTGTIDNQLDIDWYAMEVGAGQTQQVILEGSDFARNNCRLYLCEQREIVQNPRLIKAGEHSLTIDREGVYYVGVYADNWPANGNTEYTLSMSEKSDAPELNFTPVGGGKYIYSSNPEHIVKEHLGENHNMLDNYDNLEPGTYTYMAWYHNQTGSSIYTDVLLNAMGSSAIRVNKLGVQVFEDGNSRRWTGIQAYSDFLEQTIDNIHDINENNPAVFYPTALALPKKEYTEPVWLSDIYTDAYGRTYPVMENSNTPIYVIMEFEVLGAPSTLSTVAYKAGTEKRKLDLTTAPFIQDVDVTGFNTSCPSWKGMSGYMPRVETDTLYHTITEPQGADSYAMPVIVSNTFGRRTVSQWFTHLNPQNDIYNYQNIPESSMLAFDYYDQHDNAAWRFDTKRTALARPPEGYPWEGFTPNDVLPDLTLDPGAVIPSGYYTGLKKYLFSVSQGNYSVENVYHLEITNPTDSDWTFNYQTQSASGIVVGISVNGDQMEYSCAGSHITTPRFVGRTVEIPRKSTVQIEVSVTLTTGDSGGISNEFYLAKKY